MVNDIEKQVLIQKVKTKITNLLAKVWFPNKDDIQLYTEKLHIPLGLYANIIEILTKVEHRQNSFLDQFLIVGNDANTTAAACSSTVDTNMTLITNLQTQLDSLSIRVDIIDGKVDTLDEQTISVHTLTSTNSNHNEVYNNNYQIICDVITGLTPVSISQSFPDVLDIRRHLSNNYRINITVKELNYVLYTMCSHNMIQMHQNDKSRKPTWSIAINSMEL
jgi:hypothetical protein